MRKTKMDLLYSRQTVIHSILSFLLRVYMWLARERVNVIWSGEDTDAD